MSLFLAMIIPMIMIAVLLNYALHDIRVDSGKLVRLVIFQYCTFGVIIYCMTVGEEFEKLILSGVFIVAMIFINFLHFVIVKQLYKLIPISCQGALEVLTRCTEYILIPVTLYGTVYCLDLILH